MGISFANQHSFEGPLRDAALRRWQLGEALQVLQVTPQSPAAEAGVRPGDTLVSVNGTPLAVGEQAAAEALEQFSALATDQPAKLTLSRDRHALTLAIQPQAHCDYPLVLLADDEVNAFADHRRVLVTRGMLRFATSDQELSLVLAHELAHNLLGHVPSTVQNALVGGMLDLLAIGYGIPSPGTFAVGGYRRYSQAFETEADHLGLYLMARAGLSLQGAAGFWRRMASDQPAYIEETGGSHPSHAQRFLHLESTLEEIRDKQARGEPLTPSLDLLPTLRE
nr:M48 family metallopeptidase [Motiliproteus sp. SC1-56]